MGKAENLVPASSLPQHGRLHVPHDAEARSGPSRKNQESHARRGEVLHGLDLDRSGVRLPVRTRKGGRAFVHLQVASQGFVVCGFSILHATRTGSWQGVRGCP